MNVTTHERPGVYSVYGASSLVRGSGGRKTVGLAAVNTKAEAGVIQTITSYEEAVSTFGSQADSQDMAELIRVILLNGAAAVAVVPWQMPRAMRPPLRPCPAWRTSAWWCATARTRRYSRSCGTA